MNFFNAKTYEKEIAIAFPTTSVVRLLWHARLNQIFATTSNGRVKVFFDGDKSFRSELYICQLLILTYTHAE